MNEIVGHSVLILGYGREGKSVYRYLRRKYPGIKIAIADRQKVKLPPDRDLIFYTGKDYLDHLDKFDTVVRSPGVPARLVPLQRYAKKGHITSATNIFFSEVTNFTVGVTGTKGKSTTASLIERILKKKFRQTQLVGNIGKPALDYLSRKTNKTVFVMELSSHQLEDCRYSPNIAVILNIYPEHLKHFSDIKSYVEAKGHIVKFQTETDMVVTNPNYTLVKQLVKKSAGQKFYYAKDFTEGLCCFIKNGQLMARSFKKPIMSLRDSPLKGEHNVENIMAAATVGIVLGIQAKKIAEAIKTFKPLPHRLEFVANIDGREFFNDSLATIPEATISALKTLGDRVETLIVGGYDRGIDLSSLARFILTTKVNVLILFPETGDKLWQDIKKNNIHNRHLEKYKVTSMKQAVDIAFKKTKKGRICLLSPAAASFNLFRDYADRGNQFKQAIFDHYLANRYLKERNRK